MAPLLCVLFFLSGAAGLCFETLWFHQAGLAFGSSVAASSIVLASFMAGMAIGNGVAARLAARVHRPLRVYAALELAIGACGLALVRWLPSLAPALADALRPLVDSPAALSAARLGAGFALLLVPAAAMGATLPVLIGALRARAPSFGGALGRLYGWNTLGAVVGALAGELLLVEWLGVRGTGAFAAGCNALVALVALVLARGEKALAPEVAERSTPDAPHAAVARVLAATALAGALLLALEVVWFRFLRLFVHSGSAAFAFMLGVVLAGIGIGGIAGGAWLRRRPDAWRAASALALAAGAATALGYASFGVALRPVRGWPNAAPLYVGWLAAALAFPVATLSGALFPLLGSALARHIPVESRATGLLALANTLGSAAGPLLAGFVLLPGLGIERSLALLAGGYGGVALCAATPRAWRSALVPGAAFAAALVLFPFGAMQSRYLRVPITRWHARSEHAVVAVREGRSETDVYIERRLDGEPLATFLMSDGVAMSSTAVFARRYMKLFAWWPLAVQQGTRSALLISYGLGSTAKALADTPWLQSIDVVDTSREVLALSDLLYPQDSEHPLRDPRVHVHVEDGRHFLRLSQDRYDVITGEPPPPKNAGVVDLYTREHFELLRSRLSEGGFVTWWLPVHNLLESDALAIVRAFCDVFEDCSLWDGHDLDWMLVGSRGLRGRVDEAAFSRQWKLPKVLQELRRTGFERPEQLGATFLADADWLRARSADTPPLTDDWPKRLSSRLQTDARATFEGWLDVAAARERFRDSAFIHSLWPPALRERTLDYFEAEGLIREAARGAPLAPRERLAGVDTLLGQGLATAAAWRLGVTDDQARAAEAAVAHGRPEGPHLRTLGVAALAAGEPARAARELSAAREGARGDPFLPVLEAFARCRAGEELRGAEPDDLGARDAWRWLVSHCGARREGS
ncbi:MAG TPA: fused MFS/spermidine synthase [Myxococcota bacterium]|nr:fused MFS/spermidine synthase [Myxococcota bacterium]